MPRSGVGNRALARVGECGNRRLRAAISKLPVVPISQESTRGSLPDVLPLHPELVERWVGWRIGIVTSAPVEAASAQVRSMADALNVPFCAGLGDKYVLPATVRELTSRQLTMLEYLWQVANEFFELPPPLRFFITRRAIQACVTTDVVCRRGG